MRTIAVDPQPGLASQAYTPRELPRVTGADGGLCFAYGTPPLVVPYEKIEAAAVVSFHWGNPVENQLLLFLHGDPRPWLVSCMQVEYADFGAEMTFSIDERIRAFLAHLDGQVPGLAVPESTRRYCRGEPPEEVFPNKLLTYATAVAVALDPSRSRVASFVLPEAAKRPVEEPVLRRPVGITPPEEAPALLPPVLPYLARRAEVLRGFRGKLKRGRQAAVEPLVLALWTVSLPVVWFVVIACVLVLVTLPTWARWTEAVSTGEADQPSFVLSLAGWFALEVGIVVLFVLPFLVRSRDRREGLPLSRPREVVLYGFLERLAKTLGTPAPKIVRVDAGAGVAFGPRRGDHGEAWGLDLGLSLVAGMTLAELAAAVGRELARHAERPAWRWIRRARRVDRRLAEIVEEGRQAGGSGSLPVRLVRSLGRWTLAIPRLAISVLAFSSRRLVAALERRLSPDVDRDVRRLVGEAVASDAGVRRRRLEEGRGRILEWLDHPRRRDPAPDLLPPRIAVQAHLGEAPEEGTAPGGDNASADDGTADGADVLPPIFRSALPAIVLLRDPPALMRNVTDQLYAARWARPTEVEPVAAVLERSIERREESEASRRFFAEALLSRRPLGLPGEPPSGEPPADQLVRFLTACRRQIVDHLHGLRRVVRDYDRAAETRLQAREARALLEVGAGPEACELELAAATPAAARAAENEAVERLRKLAPTLAGFESLSAKRLMAALSLIATEARSSSLPGGAQWRREVPHLLASLARIHGAFGRLLEVHDACSVLHCLREHGRRPLAGRQEAALRFQRDLEGLRRLTEPVVAALGDARDFFMPAGWDPDLAVRGVPSDDFELAREVLRRVERFRSRALARLAHIAENIELAAGLEPLPLLDEPFRESRPLAESPPARPPRQIQTS